MAEHADIWHCFGDPPTLAHKMAMLRQHCADVGRDPATIEVSTAVAGAPTPAGVPDVLGEQLRALGVSMFTVGAHGPHYDLGPLKDWIAWRDESNR